MGGSKPTPPTIIMPEESNPQAFQTIIPQKSYKDLAESMGRTEKEYNRLLDNGVAFHSAPKDFGQVKATYGRDCDGNIFEIQEIIDQNHPAKVF